MAARRRIEATCGDCSRRPTIERPRKAQATTVLLTERALADSATSSVTRSSSGDAGRPKLRGRHPRQPSTRFRENPGILRLEPNFAPGLYFYRVRKHFLVCDVRGQSAARQTVTVLTVIHTSMDLPTRLAELEPRLVAEAEMLREKLRGMFRE